MVDPAGDAGQPPDPDAQTTEAHASSAAPAAGAETSSLDFAETETDFLVLELIDGRPLTDVI